MNENHAIHLRVPAPLRPYTGKQSSVRLRGGTVAEAMSDLVEQYPTLRKQILDEDGRLRNFVRLFLNGQDIHEMQGVETPLAAGDRLALIPAIAGGKELSKNNSQASSAKKAHNVRTRLRTKPKDHNR